MPVDISIAMLAALTLIVIAVLVRKQSVEHQPRISDEEFLARCRPGVDRDIALKVRRIVSECLAVNYDRITPSTNFIEDLGAD